MTHRPGRAVTLRRRLVLVLVVVLLAFSAALGVASALAVRDNLNTQLDDELRAANDRAARFPVGTPDDDDAPTATPVPPPGQDAGTINLHLDDDQAIGGFVNEDGTWVSLTTAQVAALASIPADGTPHDVELPGLGSYRALAALPQDDGERDDLDDDADDADEDAPDEQAGAGGSAAGEIDSPVVVTAISTTTVATVVQQYVVVEVLLAGAGVILAGLAGAWLVRRALRPLNAVSDAATRVSELPLDRGEVASIPRVDDSLADERTEVGQVGAALNRMLDHVENSLTARHESETQVRQFVADASHELRTPLASIRGYAELVRRSPDEVPPDTARALDRIESEASRMGSLVEDLLLLARLDAGRPLAQEPVDLTILAVDAVTDAHAAGADHQWELDLPGGGDDDVDISTALTVIGDEMRLRQVFTNLVGNARVHTPTGTRVVVSVHAEGGSVVLRISDDGPGIPAEQIPHLFQRFSRGHPGRTGATVSTGLGLAIVQAIVEAHGGRIDVRSRTAAPAGTTFEVRLPVVPAAPLPTQ